MNQTPVRTDLKLFLGVLLLVTVALLVYQQTAAHALVWDSKYYLLGNKHISRFNAENLIWMLKSLEYYNWHPLTWVSWALDYQMYGGLDPWGFHLSNNIIHSLNGSLVFILAMVVFGLNDPGSKSYPINTDNRSLIAAFLAALMFVVHPQHVESVAWVAERKDLLCQLFLLLSLLAYVQYVTCRQAHRTRWYVGVVFLYSLAVLSKPMAATFPAVLLLIDVYPLRRTRIIKPILSSIEQKSFGQLLAEKIPFILLSMLLIILTLMAQQAALSQKPLDLRVLNAFNSVVLYLVHFLVPVHLSPHYPYAVSAAHAITWKAFTPVVVFLVITWAVFRAWTRHRPAWLVSWLFYLLTLSPVIGLIQVGGQGAADRYTYFPMLPVYLLVAAGILRLLKRSGKPGKVLVFMVTLPFLAFLIATTRQQIRVWQNELTLWSHVVKAYPDDVLARDNLGIVHFNRGEYEQAATQFEISGRLPSKPTTMLAWRALTYLHLKRYKEALPDLVRLGVTSDAIPQLHADQNCILYDIGWIYAQENAIQEAQELLGRVDPNSSSGAHARTWLQWLQSAGAGNAKPRDNDLPDFCAALIPSRMTATRTHKNAG